MKKWCRGLRIKLLTIGLIPIFALAIVAMIGHNSIEQLDHELQVAYKDKIPQTELLGDVNFELNSSVRWLLNAIVIENNISERESSIARAIANIDSGEKKLRIYFDQTHSKEAKKIISEQFFPDILDAKTDINNTIKELKKNSVEGNLEAKKIFLEEVRHHTVNISNYLEKIKEIRQKRNLEAMNLSFANSDYQDKLIRGISVTAILLTLFVSIYLIASLIKSLMKLIARLDEAGQEVSSAAIQVADTAQELSHATTEQSASLQETASAVEEMHAVVKRNSENAATTAMTSEHSKSTANKGQDIVKHMIQAIEDVRSSNEKIMNQIYESNDQISDLTNVISNIANKTKVINEIVFQTKLLAFNASVEAARAGEAGKGFSVVAEEVGNLAQMSGNAAKEISDLLVQSIERVNSTVNNTREKVNHLIQEGNHKVNHGVNVSCTCDDVLKEIVSCVENVSVLSNEISMASNEQAEGIQEINKAMRLLDQVTNQNAASSHQSSSAATVLSNQAKTLKEEINQLVVMINGSEKRSEERRETQNYFVPNMVGTK